MSEQWTMGEPIGFPPPNEKETGWWEVDYLCVGTKWQCEGKTVVMDRNPVMNAVPPPLCRGHGEPMRLRRYRNLYPPPQTDAKRRRKVDKVRGGQTDLDFSGTVR